MRPDSENTPLSLMEGETVDLLVLGGGPAGLSAAVAAAEKGAAVIVLEKRGALGGNAMLAGGIFAAESPAQRRCDIDLRKDDCFRTAMDHAHWKIDPLLIRTFIERSGETINWFEEKGLMFMPFPEPIPATGGFHLPKGAGVGLINHLKDECTRLGVKLVLRADTNEIAARGDESLYETVVATQGGSVTIVSKSVVIATGGYGGNKDMLSKYCRDYHENMTCYGIPNTGDGIALAVALGADTEGLGVLHMAGPTLPKSAVLRVHGEQGVATMQLSTIILEPNTVWVNCRGRRFADEAIGSNHFGSANAVVVQPGNRSWTVFDTRRLNTWIERGFVLGMGAPMGLQGRKIMGLEEALREHVERDRVKIADNWRDIAEWIGADPEVLTATIEQYNSSCDAGYDPIFNKPDKYLTPLREPPFYAVTARADFLSTIGGIKINERMEVVDKAGSAIRGLYAAGIDTGGWSSDTYNGQLPGNAFGFAVNSGRIAGENAAERASAS